MGPIESPEKECSFIDWAQMSRFHLKKETESSLRNVVFFRSVKRLLSVYKNTRHHISEDRNDDTAVRTSI
jgi:hypothetical protein